MLYYIIPYIFILFFSLNIYFNNKSAKISSKTLFFLILPAFFIAILRGDVGTDTVYYLGFFRDLRLYDKNNKVFEPGFRFLGWLLSLPKFNERFGVASISVIITIILCKVFSRSKFEMLFFAVIFFPLFYFEITMNGIRYGLSFSIAIIAIEQLYRKKYLSFAITALLAISFHYSAIIIIFIFLIGLLKKRYIIMVGILIALSMFLFSGFFALFLAHLNGKEDAYKSSFSPSAFSGLAPLFLFFFLYINFLFLADINSYSKIIHLFFFLEIVSFIASKYSYAGLRFQSEFLFILLIYLKNNFSCIKMKRKYAIRLCIIGFLGFIVFLKNINAQIADDRSPFLPYKFYWQESDYQ